MRKRLARNLHDCVIGGVCSGLGEYTGMSTLSWRWIFALAFLFTTLPSALAYVIFWIVMPVK